MSVGSTRMKTRCLLYRHRCSPRLLLSCHWFYTRDSELDQAYFQEKQAVGCHCGELGIVLYKASHSSVSTRLGTSGRRPVDRIVDDGGSRESQLPLLAPYIRQEAQGFW